MKITVDSVIHLLHECAFGSLATQSIEIAGYPYASLLPFALDEQHRPLFLISGLAEHTKNLIADCRASFLIHSFSGQNVLTADRVSLVGDVKHIEASQQLIARYLRYHPDAEQYLSLGDFAFFKLSPKRARFVAGFGQMRWMEKAEWAGRAVFPLADELAVMQELIQVNARGIRVLGIDCYGFDMERNGKRERQRFPNGPIAVEQVGEVVKRFLTAI